MISSWEMLLSVFRWREFFQNNVEILWRKHVIVVKPGPGCHMGVDRAW
jgi:hypothetical protein